MERSISTLPCSPYTGKPARANAQAFDVSDLWPLLRTSNLNAELERVAYLSGYINISEQWDVGRLSLQQ